MRVLLHTISTLFLIISSILLLSSSINNDTLTYAAKPNTKVITNEFINNICSKSLDPTLCMDVLKNQIGHPLDKTTLSTIAVIPITLAESCTREAISITSRSWYPGRPTRQKDLFLRCYMGYGNVMVHIQEARKYAIKNNKSKVKRHASGAIKLINACDQSFVEPRPIPQPLIMKNVNKKLIALCTIIIALID
ncbi:hypothetical protein ABFX02_05G136700 [Erythranthe guttata]